MAKNTQTGGLDCSKCPQYPGKCHCGLCAICGYAKHTGIHSTVNGCAEGTKPFGHEFVPYQHTKEQA